MDNKEKVMVPFSLPKLIRTCLKNWKAFICGIVACLIMACAYIYIRKPLVEVDAQLMLPNEGNVGGLSMISDLASFSLGDMFGSSSTENEVAVMRSNTVLTATVKQLGANTVYYEKQGFMKWLPVYQNQQLRLETPEGAADTISTSLLFTITPKGADVFDIKLKARKRIIKNIKGISLPATISTPYGEYTIAKTEAYGSEPAKAFRIKFSSYNGAAQALGETINVFAPNKKTDFIQISYNTVDPAYGKILLNALIDNYNQVGNKQRHDQNNRTLEFVNARLSTLEVELAASEQQMEQFKRENNITDVEYSAASILQKSNTIESALFEAQTEADIIQVTKEFLADPENNHALIPVIGTSTNDPASAQIAAYNEMIIQRMRIAESAKPNNATLQQLDRQLEVMRGNIITSVDRAYNNALVRVNDLRAQYDATGSTVSSMPSLEREYINIERNLVLQQQLYLFLLKQREEATMSLAKLSPSLVTIDPPYVLKDLPGPTNKIILLIALFFGMLLPLVYVFYFKLPKAPMWSASEAEQLSEATVAAVISRENDSDDALAVEQPESGKSVRVLRAFADHALADLSNKTILVTSCIPNEGKTHIAANLAASMALIGKKTLLVDTNAANPGIAPLLGVASGLGIANLGIKPDNECVSEAKVGAATLYVLQPGNFEGNPADAMSNISVISAIEKIAGDYDCVVIDTPSLSEASTALSYASIASVTLMPLRIKLSTPIQAERINALISEGKLPRIAVVINQG